MKALKNLLCLLFAFVYQNFKTFNTFQLILVKTQFLNNFLPNMLLWVGTFFNLLLKFSSMVNTLELLCQISSFCLLKESFLINARYHKVFNMRRDRFFNKILKTLFRFVSLIHTIRTKLILDMFYLFSNDSLIGLLGDKLI